jgi:hypothetical protein
MDMTERVRTSKGEALYLTDRGKRGKIIEIINREEGIAMAVNTLVNIT